MNEVFKACKDCAHFQPGAIAIVGTCMAPQVVTFHYVSGEMRGQDAFTMRMTTGKCKPTAELWAYDGGSPPEPDCGEDMPVKAWSDIGGEQ